MKWVVTGVSLVAVAVVVAIGVRNGGFFHTGDKWAGRGTPVKFANEPVPPRPDDSYVVGIGGLTTDLGARVAASGGLVRPLAYDCDAQQIEPAFTCRITYLGKVVTYRVTTKSTGTDLYNWQARPDRLVAARGGIEAAMWRAYASQATAMSCDSSLPALQLVHPQATLSQRCYFKPTGDNANWGSGTENGDKTVAVRIAVYDGEINLSVVTQ